MKLPVWLLVTVRSGFRVTLVGSLAVSLEVFNSLPPETVTVLVMLAGAFAATLTVRVIEG